MTSHLESTVTAEAIASVPPVGRDRKLSSEALTASQWGVLALLCSLSMITYLDRVCFGVAAPSIARDLNLGSVADLKWAFTAFAIAYALFEIPTGWLGDRWGPRAMLTRIVLWWSVCTALTGLVGLQYGSWTFGGLGTLILLRFLFGAGEAGAYPNITRALYNWFPPQRWEFAQGLIWMSGRLMGGITPLIWALMVTGTSWTSSLVNWRGAFLVFGLVGVFWCVLFRLFFRNHPQPCDTSEEIVITMNSHVHSAVPWKLLLTNRDLVILCLAYSLLNYGWAFNITYFPSYIQQRFPASELSTLIALYAGAPLWIGAIGCLSGGYCVSWIDRRIQNRRRSRRLLGVLAMLGCAICWTAASQADNLHVFCISVALAAFCVDLTLGAAWASCQDIGREHTAVAAAMMNTVGTFGAALAGWLTGTLVQRSISQRALIENIPVSSLSDTAHHQAALQGFQFVFVTYIAIYIVAAACWMALTVTKSEPLSGPSGV